jgi:hypothetical protein
LLFASILARKNPGVMPVALLNAEMALIGISGVEADVGERELADLALRRDQGGNR